MSAELAVMEITALIRSGTSATVAKRQLQTSELSEFQVKQFQFIWEVATESGGHLALALDRLTEVFRAQQRQFVELVIAFASPRATANLIRDLFRAFWSFSHWCFFGNGVRGDLNWPRTATSYCCQNQLIADA